jgi:hypothetical protein
MRLNVDREPGFYHDESGERFQQLFREAEEKREATRDAGYTILVIGTFVVVCLALVLAKLYTIGAVVGVK